MGYTRCERDGWGHEPAVLEEFAAAGSDHVRRLARCYEHGFGSALYPSVGLEEELILVDAASLLPVSEVGRVLGLVGRDGRFISELRACQLELRTPVCVSVADAGRELAAARARLVERLEGRVRLLAVGTHPASSGPNVVTARQRYRRIAVEWPWAMRRGQPSGLHVHVGIGIGIGIGGAAEALAVSMRPVPTCRSWPRWLPTRPSSKEQRAGWPRPG